MIKRPWLAPLACTILLAAAHAALCWVYLSNTQFVSFRSNEYSIFLAAYDLARHLPILNLRGFPPFPIFTYALFFNLLPKNLMLAQTIAEITVSTGAIILLFQVCLALGFDWPWAGAITLIALLQPANIQLGPTTSFNDNFMYFSILLAVLGWLKYSRTGN
jgi:hypothetical protein